MGGRWMRAKPVGGRLGTRQRARKGKQPPEIRVDDTRAPYGSTPGSTGHRNSRQYLTKGDRVCFYGHWGTVTAMKSPRRGKHRKTYPKALVKFDDVQYQARARNHWIDCRNLQPPMKI